MSTVIKRILFFVLAFIGIALCITLIYSRYQASYINELEKSLGQQKEELSKYRTVISEANQVLDLAIEEEKKSFSIHLKYYIARHNYTLPEEIIDIVADSIIEISHEKDINPLLTIGLIHTESHFNPMAESEASARGLMQVMYDVWKDELDIKSTRQLYGIKSNIRHGIDIFQRYLVENDNSVTKALKAYNGTDKDEFPNKVYSNIGRFVMQGNYNPTKTINLGRDK